MTINAINTHGGLANQPESPVRFNTNAVASAPRMPNSTMGEAAKNRCPPGQVHAAYPPSFNIRRNICNRINSLYFMKSQKDKSYIRRILSPSTLKGTGCGAASPPLGSLGRDGQGRGSLPQSHVPSQNLFRESTSTGRERIKSSVLDNDS